MGLTVEQHLTAYDVRISGEATAPERATENHNVRGSTIFFGTQKPPPNLRFHSEQIEEFRRYVDRAYPFRLPNSCEGRAALTESHAERFERMQFLPPEEYVAGLDR